MTSPDPLREDEVEAVARAIAQDMSPGSVRNVPAWVESRWPAFRSSARAAILRLDEVRGRGE